MPAVETAHCALLQQASTGSQIVRNGYRHCARQSRLIAIFTQALEQRIPAQRKPDCAEAPIWVTLRHVVDRKSQILRFTRMVEPRGAVRLAAARSKVDADRSNAAPEQLAIRVDRVPPARRALEPVKQQNDRRMLTGRRRDVQVEKIAVRRVQPDPLERRWRGPAQQPPSDRLPVRRG